MSLKFLSAFATQKVQDAAQSAIAALVLFDPKGATEAQISLMDGQLDQLGLKVSSTQRQYNDAKQSLDVAQRLNGQRLTAAESLQALIAAGDASKEASLNSLLNIIEQAQPDLNGLKRDEAEVKAYLADLQTAFRAAADKLKTARSELGQAQRGMERADLARDRAHDRADAAALAAGVHTAGDALNTALGAMKAKTAAAEDAAGAANLKALTLAPQDYEKDDPNIAAAMAGASGEPTKPQSVSERLAALKNAA